MFIDFDIILTSAGVGLGILGVWFTKVKKLLRQSKELIDVGIATSDLFNDVIDAYEDETITNEEVNQIVGQVVNLRAELKEFGEIIK